ncbi:MAG TPA: hypothetical protein DCO77_02920 [Nitrospiraceae bacterium]|nr:hypothetical protein [Nitrospiraceae bacterium]
MGSRELIESLRKAADEKIQAIQQDAETETRKIKAEAVRRKDELRQDYARVQSAEAEEYGRARLAEANSRARALRLAAEQALAQRLQAAARSSLHSLRGTGYPGIFAALAQELPPLAWDSVRVNPEDVGLAKKQFPNAEIVADEEISGGMDAAAEGGRVRVVNTFEKRLERMWMHMLPALMTDAGEQDQPPSEKGKKHETTE